VIFEFFWWILELFDSVMSAGFFADLQHEVTNMITKFSFRTAKQELLKSKND
jgi:hypothetical protein